MAAPINTFQSASRKRPSSPGEADRSPDSQTSETNTRTSDVAIDAFRGAGRTSPPIVRVVTQGVTGGGRGKVARAAFPHFPIPHDAAAAAGGMLLHSPPRAVSPGFVVAERGTPPSLFDRRAAAPTPKTEPQRRLPPASSSSSSSSLSPASPGKGMFSPGRPRPSMSGFRRRGSVSPFRSPPPTPARARAGSSPSNLFRQKQRECSTFSITINGQKFSLHSPQSGDFKTTYFFADGEKEVYDGRKGKELVLKVYSQTRAQRSSDRELLKMTTHACEQHKHLQDAIAGGAPLSVSAILNDPVRDGFFLCERVDTTWTIDQELLAPDTMLDGVGGAESAASEGRAGHFEGLPETLKVQLHSFRDFLVWAYTNKVALDINTGNFGVKSDNTLTLIDFMELDSDDDAPQPFLNTIVRNLVSRNESVLAFLCEPLVETHPRLVEVLKLVCLG